MIGVKQLNSVVTLLQWWRNALMQMQSTSVNAMQISKPVKLPGLHDVRQYVSSVARGRGSPWSPGSPSGGIPPS